MAEPTTIARPYAEAVFKLADAQGKLADWSATLANVAAVAADERVRAAVGDPNLSDAKAAGLVISILAGKLSGDAENFVRVLAENGRLDVVTEIRTHFETLKNEREGVVEAEVFTAFEMDQAQVSDLVARLEKKTGRKVKTRVSVDKALIGGVKIVIGDKVIDGSARAQLAALENALKAG
jgi:F-type H+-transporting ATPase subunit delta